MVIKYECGDRGDKENGDKGDKGPAHGIIHSKHVHVTRVDTLIHENRWESSSGQ